MYFQIFSFFFSEINFEKIDLPVHLLTLAVYLAGRNLS